MLKLKLQYSGHLMWRIDSMEKILMLEKIKGKKENRAAEVRCYYWCSGHEFDREIVKDGETWCADSPWGYKELDMNYLMNNNNNNKKKIIAE